MVESNDADNLNPELENRLDDLFDDNDTPLPDNEDPDASEYYPLSELKKFNFIHRLGNNRRGLGKAAAADKGSECGV